MIEESKVGRAIVLTATIVSLFFLSSAITYNIGVVAGTEAAAVQFKAQAESMAKCVP